MNYNKLLKLVLILTLITLGVYGIYSVLPEYLIEDYPVLINITLSFMVLLSILGTVVAVYMVIIDPIMCWLFDKSFKY